MKSREQKHLQIDWDRLSKFEEMALSQFYRGRDTTEIARLMNFEGADAEAAAERLVHSARERGMRR